MSGSPRATDSFHGTSSRSEVGEKVLVLNDNSIGSGIKDEPDAVGIDNKAMWLGSYSNDLVSARFAIRMSMVARWDCGGCIGHHSLDVIGLTRMVLRRLLY